MFATLTGTNTASPQCHPIFARLCDIAIALGFEPPDTTHRVQRDQAPLEGWTLDQKGPSDGKASFFLSVTAPKVPGVSPIPIKKTIAGPLFAVMVMDSVFVVFREDRRDVSEHSDSDSVAKSFGDFLKSIKAESEAPKEGNGNRNSNVQSIDAAKDSPIGNARFCQRCKKRPGKMEWRIAPPMRSIEMCLCAECSQSIIS